MTKAIHKFKAIESLILENSFTVLKEQKDVELHVTVGINSDTYGWFEIYDEETSGDEWYAEGGIWIKDKVITDYDGVFSLPECIVNKLRELGYDVSDVE